MSMEPIVQIIFALLPSYPLPTICFRSVTSNNIPFLYLKKKIVPLIFIFFFLLCTSIFPSFPQFGRGIGVISSFCPKQKHALCSQTSVIPFFFAYSACPMFAAPESIFHIRTSGRWNYSESSHGGSIQAYTFSTQTTKMLQSYYSHTSAARISGLNHEINLGVLVESLGPSFLPLL